ncbi:type IV toxin-antitoxin system AbiEi family antitoxin domain-containing protein [Frondihabitans peucedani]|uniref:DUF559 domain-containing protein n=1 Tax=Frondihabitans peucedani TaxID=598626 RepID=A0ABP8DZK6_9MICO
MGPIQKALWAGGGFATSRQLRAAGATFAVLRELVETGRLVRARQGVYALPAAPEAGVAALRLGGRLAGISAAETFGLWGGWDEPLTVCLRANSSSARARRGERPEPPGDPAGPPISLHWSDDPHDTDWCWRVSLDRCLAQTLRWCREETAVAVLDTALTLGVVDRASLLARVEHSPRLMSVVMLARAGSGSGPESILRQRLAPMGLVLAQQVPIDGVGLVDFRIVGTPVLVEVDGYRFHSSPERFADDRRRDAEARARGFVPMRFTALQVRDRWPWVESMVLRAVAVSAHAPVVVP